MRQTITTTLLAIVLGLTIVFTGCAGMTKLFEPPEPFCTETEQADSIIYKYLNPGDADFTLILVMAAYLDKRPEEAQDVKEKLIALKDAVEKGVTYDSFASLAHEKFGTLKAVVLSRALKNFKGVKAPVSVCDKRMIMGHIDNQIEIVDMVK